MASDSILDLVDEHDVVVGQEWRSVIHQKGLRHREVHVWFVTPAREIIFQRRSATKQTFPNLLDSTVGGHVEQGQTYDTAALAEVFEETGLRLDLTDLTFLKKSLTNITDHGMGLINHNFRAVYGYVYRGALSDLKIEDGEGTGFEAFPIDDLFSLPPERAAQFIPVLLDPTLYKDLYDVLARMAA